ncbi:MAG: DUF4258 domain-containing protein [Thermoanaerobaculia bacterium]
MAGTELGSEILKRVRDAASKRFLFLPHAVKQMTRPERMITAAAVEAVVMAGELIEDYPEDVRGHSCLLLGFEDAGDPVHVVCSPKDDYLAIITAYRPKPDQWSADFRQGS